MKWSKLLVLVVAPTVSYPVTILAANYYNQSFGLVVLLATFLYAVCLYFGTFQPSLDLQRDERLPIIRCILTELDQTLRSGASGNCQLRYNVMELKGKPWNKHLRITVCTEGHSEAELEIEWKKGYGNCGKAWRDKEQGIYDEKDANRQKMTKTQEELTSNVMCVLSTPILSRTGRVQGVLNIDSTTCDCRSAGFEKPRVQTNAKTYAQLLARVL
ncbi:MAG: hypothetical protein M1133_07940 [Armatimonadetes bacterium]|nr:hypothetical protein [Armatimonadota bacterium]